MVAPTTSVARSSSSSSLFLSSRLVFLLAALLVFSAGSTPCLAFVDPPPGTTKVYVTIYYNAVSQIDGVLQQYQADFYLSAFWIDNRVDPMNGTAEIWEPVIEFPNALETESTIYFPFILGVTPSASVLGLDGPVPAGTWIRFDQRYIVTLSTPMPLTDFPFDTQSLEISIESALFPADVVEFVPVGGLVDKMIPEAFHLIEWNLLQGEVDIDEYFYPNYEESYSRMMLKLTVARQSQYYIWKIIVGSILLVLMAIFIFVMRPDETERLAATITVFLALITFLFVAGLSVPKVAYQTRLDTFMNFSFFTVFLMCMMHAFFYTVRVSFKRRRDPVPSRHASVTADQVDEAFRVKSAEELAVEEDIMEGRSGKRGCIARFIERELKVDVRHLGGIKRMDIACAVIIFVAYTAGVLLIFLTNL